jgi:hypothetical protein
MEGWRFFVDLRRGKSLFDVEENNGLIVHCWLQ